MTVFNGVDQGAEVTGIASGSAIRIKFVTNADYSNDQVGYACVVDGRGAGGFLAEHNNTDPTLTFVGGTQLLIDGAAATFLRPAEAPSGSEIQIYAATGANVGTSFHLFRQPNGTVPLLIDVSLVEIWDGADTTLLHSFTMPATVTSLTINDSVGSAVLTLSGFATNAAPVIDTPEADIVEPAGTAWTRDISDNSSDADLDTLTYSVSPALPTGITLNGTTGVITATTSTVAQVPTNYTFTHSDGTDSVDDIVSIQITGILSVGGDNEMDNNETDVLIATTGLPASVTTFTSVKVNSVVMDNPRWNSGQPLFDAPSGMALGSALVVEVEFTE